VLYDEKNNPYHISILFKDYNEVTKEFVALGACIIKDEDFDIIIDEEVRFELRKFEIYDEQIDKILLFFDGKDNFGNILNTLAKYCKSIKIRGFIMTKPIAERLNQFGLGTEVIYRCPKCNASFSILGDKENFCHNCGANRLERRY
jgi:DNA-directed RNA polymerase subunit RPC12/RpoP